MRALITGITGQDGRRFWAKVRKSDGCWLWQASTSVGYGQINIGGRPQRAHRVAWELTFGGIPDGLWVLHRCDTRLCVRPGHLFLGTVTDNNRDMFAKGRNRSIGRAGRPLPSHCCHGHPFTEANIYRRRDGRGRECRYCNSHRSERAS